VGVMPSSLRAFVPPCLVARLPCCLSRFGLSEEIISYKRRWFVVLEDAPTALPALLAHRRAVRDVGA